MSPPQPVSVVAALGPNPAPLTELIWALRRQRNVTVARVHVVVDEHGQHYLEHALLTPGGALEELAALLDVPLGAAALDVRVVKGPSGTALDDEDPAHAELYNTAIWDLARDATSAAGAAPVVFGLTAGRRRTMTAMSTMAFQLLARPQDLCVDVRVTDPRAEGGSGFFFPEQRQQQLLSRREEPFLAREVEVQLVDVRLPRLRGLLASEAATSSTSDTAMRRCSRSCAGATRDAVPSGKRSVSSSARSAARAPVRRRRSSTVGKRAWPARSLALPSGTPWGTRPSS